VVAAALAANALASGWNVTILTSTGIPESRKCRRSGAHHRSTRTLYPASPSTPACVRPAHNRWEGATNFTAATFTGIYIVQDPTGTKAPLTGFSFVVGGFVWDFGQIVAFKKVVDLRHRSGALHGQLALERRRLPWRR
jgi:hypothetical protein